MGFGSQLIWCDVIEFIDSIQLIWSKRSDSLIIAFNCIQLFQHQQIKTIIIAADLIGQIDDQI